jgi:GTP-binding protein
MEKHLNMLRSGLGLPEELKIYPYSALKKTGRDEIYELMDSILAEDGEKA